MSCGHVGFYDLVGAGCSFSRDFASVLGFARVFAVGSDISMVSDSKDALAQRYIASGSNHSRLSYHAKHGAAALVVESLEAETGMLDSMRDSGCAMVIPLGTIVGTAGCARYRSIRNATKLFSACRKFDIPVAFVSMARSQLFMESYMQLISLAELVGADEAYARYSLSSINASLGGNDGGKG